MDSQPNSNTDNAEPKESLLDRVLLSQQTDALEHFSPLETVNELLKHLNQKEADVLRRRFGLGTEPAETLEVIGKRYQVTRERVRQIERWAIDRLQHLNSAKQHLHALDVLLQQLLEERGGVMLEEDLLQELLSHTTNTPAAKAATMFLLQELMADKLERVETKQYKPYWKLRFSTPILLDEVITAAAAAIEKSGQPLAHDRLLNMIQESAFWKEHADRLTESMVFAYISVATSIEQNPFGEYGLREWGSIVPKRMNDKILLVMRRHGKPMHFQDITKRINEIGFDHRQAYPPTVHNELILNKEYVLIGRGIYALREWGYKPGVVADVLAAILTDAKAPLSRQELVDKVLEQRVVKKNTVHLALTNKDRFARLSDGRYTLASADKTQTNDLQSRHS